MGWFVCNNGYPLENKPYLIFKGGEVHSQHILFYVHERISGLRNPESSTIKQYQLCNAKCKLGRGPIDHEKLPAEMLVDYIPGIQL